MVTEQATNNYYGRVQWFCNCDCGVVNKPVLSILLTKGKARSCGCLEAENLAKISIARRLRPFEAIYNRLVKAASYRGYLCDLSYEEYLDFTKFEKCHYCSDTLNWSVYSTVEKGHFIDRKDNTLGYTKDNCVVCCPRCNRSKSNSFSYKEWVEIGKTIREFRERNRENDSSLRRGN